MPPIWPTTLKNDSKPIRHNRSTQQPAAEKMVDERHCLFSAISRRWKVSRSSTIPKGPPPLENSLLPGLGTLSSAWDPLGFAQRPWNVTPGLRRPPTSKSCLRARRLVWAAHWLCHILRSKATNRAQDTTTIEEEPSCCIIEVQFDKIAIVLVRRHARRTSAYGNSFVPALQEHIRSS